MWLEFVSNFGWERLAALGAVSVGLLIVALWLVRLLRGRQVAAGLEPPDLEIDVAELDCDGPPADGPRLEIYGTPVRLAIVVVAPIGRAGVQPPAEVVPGLAGQLVPGLDRVLVGQQPRICQWPSQLSSRGFTQSFFNNVRLPGYRGKGTPWCSIAGRFEGGGRPYLVGLVCAADRDNPLGQITIQHEGQWLDAVRVRQ